MRFQNFLTIFYDSGECGSACCSNSYAMVIMNWRIAAFYGNMLTRIWQAFRCRTWHIQVAMFVGLVVCPIQHLSVINFRALVTIVVNRVCSTLAAAMRRLWCIAGDGSSISRLQAVWRQVETWMGSISLVHSFRHNLCLTDMWAAVVPHAVHLQAFISSLDVIVIVLWQPEVVRPDLHVIRPNYFFIFSEGNVNFRLPPSIPWLRCIPRLSLAWNRYEDPKYRQPSPSAA